MQEKEPSTSMKLSRRFDACPLGLFAGHATLPSQVVPDFPVSVEQFFR